MKRTPLRPSLKPIARRVRPKVKGKSRFPKQRQPKYLAWIRVLPCFAFTNTMSGCGWVGDRRRVEPAHILPRNRGTPDVGNTLPLCPRHHDLQEGERYLWGFDLLVEAQRLATQYQETA